MATEAVLPLPSDVGGRIKYARRFLHGWSQRELSEKTAEVGCLVTEPQLQRIESGQRPDLGQLLAIAKAMGLTVLQLGATSADYPEIHLFVETGWDPEKTVLSNGEIRCDGTWLYDLDVRTSPLRPIATVIPFPTPKG
jgi:transcriptional regulator with XRE-family HTH domain